MPRPRIPRCVRFRPGTMYYKPVGVPLRTLHEVVLLREEIEALKLYEIDGLDQKQSAKQMGVSQPTFARMLDAAHKKISEAIINGKAIRIESS